MIAEWYVCRSCKRRCFWDSSRTHVRPRGCPLGRDRASWEPHRYEGAKQ